MVDKDQGVQFIGDLKKIHYGDLRAALLQNYTEKGNKSLQTTADGEETIWGLKTLDEFFGYEAAKEGEGKPGKPGINVLKITTDKAREFAKKRLTQGAANDTINGSLALLRRMLILAHEEGETSNRAENPHAQTRFTSQRFSATRPV